MLSSIKASIKDSFIFGFGNVAVKVIGLVLIPLYTNPKYFSVDDFGWIGLLDISGLVIISLLASSLPQSLTRWYWAKGQENNQEGIFFMSFTSQVIISLAFCLILIPFSGTLSGLIFKTSDLSQALIYIIISSALQGINNIVNTLLRLQSRSFLFMITNLVKLLIVLLLTIFFIVKLDMGIEGIYLAQVIGNLLIILILMPYIIRNCSIKFDPATFSSMMTYGLPLILAAFSTILLNVIDRFALNSLALLKFVALYTLAYKLSSSLKLVLVDTVKLAIFPRMIKKIDSPDNKRFYSKAMLYTSYVVMFGIIGVSLFSPEAIKLLSKTQELWGAYILVPVLSLSTFFINMREVSVYGLIATKKTQRLSLIVFISTLLNIGLNLLLIPRWNAMGAAFSTLLSQFFYWIFMHSVAQKTYYVPYENRKIILLFFTGTLLSLTGLLINDMELLPRLLIKLICLGSFPFLLYIINFYEAAEIQAIKGFFSKWSDLKNLGNNIASLKGINDDN